MNFSLDYKGPKGSFFKDKFMPEKFISNAKSREITKWIEKHDGRMVVPFGDGVRGSASYFVQDEPLAMVAMKGNNPEEQFHLMVTDRQARVLVAEGVESFEKVRSDDDSILI